MGERPSVTSRAGRKTPGPGSLDPRLGGQKKAVATSLISNSLEFDGIKILVVNLLPNAEKKHGVLALEPLLDERATALKIPHHVSKRTALRFHQVTDVARSIGDPARFTPENSLDQSKENLNDEAQRRINLLVYRLRPISIGGIEIEGLPGKHPTVVVNQDLALLKQLISAALKRNGVEAPPRTNNDEAGACYQRLQPDEPAVCVDVWQ